MARGGTGEGVGASFAGSRTGDDAQAIEATQARARSSRTIDDLDSRIARRRADDGVI
jgi:hypothetical protein